MKNTIAILVQTVDLNEFKKTEIQIIEKKERPKNGFVLSEKTDLENTEAFKK